MEPTVIVTTNPKAQLMTEEIFGPVLTVLVYPDYFYKSILSLCNESSACGLTGSIFVEDTKATMKA